MRLLSWGDAQLFFCLLRHLLARSVVADELRRWLNAAVFEVLSL